jgi:hypothetical protein
MVMKNVLILLLLIGFNVAKAQKIPKSGTYIYTISFIEGEGKPQGETCKVVIDGYKIKVIHNGGKLSGKKGDIIDEGTIMKHAKTGKWIIGKKESDKNAPEIGGCSDGPIEVDFKHNIVWLC